jgi:hypothetical protein
MYIPIPYAHAIPISWPSCPLIIAPRIVNLANEVLGPKRQNHHHCAQIIIVVAFTPAALLMSIVLYWHTAFD